MEKKFIINDCSLIPSEGSSLKQEFNIAGGNPTITYFESIKSPAISLSLNFIDVDQLISREGITGGEYLSLRIKVQGYDKEFEIKPDKHLLMLNSVKNVTTSSSKQVATLEFLSVEAIINETSRVNQRFTGNVTDTVKKLLKDKKGIKTKKNLDSDQATNSYSFVGNLKRPFDTIQWLCSKTQSSKDGTGFLFFETLDGYVFKSIESLLDGETVEYKKSETPDESSGLTILENNLNQTSDIGMSCRMGMYANKTIYINVDNATLKTVDYRIESLKLKKPPKLPNGLEKNPTRLMLRVLDKCALQKGSKKKEIQKENELAIYQSKSYARANLIFSQSMSVSIPFNPELRAGQMLDLRFPLRKSEGDDQDKTTYGTESDDDVSGKYLISELKHNIGGNRANTEVTLIRDAFTA
jgi:hypothetical protein